MTPRTHPLLIALAGLLLVGPAAYAQEMPIPENVTSASRPEADAVGLPLGGFRAYPKLLVLGGYDSNILASDSSTIEAGRTTILPSLLIQSQWAQHSLSFATFLKSRLYPGESQEDYLDWGFGSKGHLDIRESTNLGGSINYQRLTEDRSGIDVVTAAPDPSNYGQFDVNAVFNHTIDQLTGSAAVSYTNLKYRTDDQSFRDRGLVRGTAQLGYVFSPGYSAFVRGVINDRDYEHIDPIAGVYQDSLGYRIVGGISSQLTDLIAGEVNVGYMAQNYDASVFKDVSTVTFGANLTWFATRLTTVTLKVGRDVVDATTGTTGAILYTTAGFGIEHDFTDDIELRTDFEYYNGDYEGISREDDGFRVSPGFSYIINRFVHLDVRYRFDNRDSNLAGQDFDRHQVDLGFEFQI